MGEGRWSLPSPFLGTASSSIPPCGNNTRKQPAGDYSGERRNLSGVSLSRLRLRKHAVTSLCALKTDSYTSTTRVPKSKAAAFQQRAEESPAPDCKSQRSCPSGLHHVLFSPLRFFFSCTRLLGCGPPSQSVCACVWYKVLEGISRDDRVSLSSFDKHSYILRNSLTRCRGRRPSCLFPVKLLIWKQTQCLR